MKNILFAAVIALSAGVLGAEEVPDAADLPEQAGETDPQTARARIRKQSGAQYYIDQLDPIVNLTDQQKQRIDEICEESRKLSIEWMKKNGEKSRASDMAVSRARESGDQQAIQQAQQDFQTLHEPMINQTKKLGEDLKKVFTRDQHRKLIDHQAERSIKALTDPIVLKPNQVRQVKAAFRDMVENAEPGSATNIKPLVDEVLTAEQKLAIDQHRAMIFVKHTFTHASLTEQQMKHAERICADVLRDPDIGEERYALIQQRLTETLSKEQREAMNPTAPANPTPAHMR